MRSLEDRSLWRRFAAWTWMVREARSRALDIVYPGFCRVCGDPSPGEAPLCPRCESLIPWIRRACSRCGLPVRNPGSAACGECSGRILGFDRALAPAEYTGPWRALILRFKYLGDQGVRGFVASAMARAWADRLARDPSPWIVPVPPHPWRKFLRSRDPVEELAGALGEEVRVPVRQVLRRARWIPSQTSLPREMRLGNPRGAYEVRSRSAKRRWKLPASVVLLDDVLTTCATASECARALKEAGAKEVTVLAAARSPA